MIPWNNMPVQSLGDIGEQVYRDLNISWSGPTIKQIRAKKGDVPARKMRKWFKHVLENAPMLEREYRLLGMDHQANYTVGVIEGAAREMARFKAKQPQAGLIKRSK